MNYPRVLVISNNSFSKSNSNGRTLGSLFKGWPKDKLAQFCISTDSPDFDVCNNYFCVGDKAVLNSMVHFRAVKRNDLMQTDALDSVTIPANRIKRTPIKSIIRHLIWSLGIWKGIDFKSWLDLLSPEIVVIQSGDTAFTHDLALSISKKYHAKLCFFNTEGIYFMNKNFLFSGICDVVFFPLYKKVYENSYRKAMHFASYAVYLNEMLKADNDVEFNVPSCVIYNSSDIKSCPKSLNAHNIKFSYLGNFNYNRVVAIIEIGEVLQNIDKSYVLDVYGNARADIEQILSKAPGIRYHGFVDYTMVKQIINDSDILFHAECQQKEYEEPLKYGFSTKIADSLSSGRSFVLYASPSLACSQYLQKTGAGWYVKDKSELETTIRTILHNTSAREQNISKSLEVANNNHSSLRNSKIFQAILIEVYQGQ